MEHGFSNAVAEITLVIFTTLGPAGVVAFALVGSYAVLGNLPVRDSQRLGSYLIVPILMVVIGLIASATHLGTPSNALYVFSGIGRSPLSNEVGCGVLFLVSAAIAWTLFFPLGNVKRWRRPAMVVSILIGLLFILTVSLAYSVPTIATWASPFASASQWFLAFLLGPFIAQLACDWSGVSPSRSFEKLLLALSCAALLLGVVVFFMQDGELTGIVNSWTTASESFSYYKLAIVCFAGIESLSIGLSARNRLGRPELKKHSFLLFCLAAFGVFGMRFLFYVMHLTVGL